MLLCGLNSEGSLNKTEELFLQIDQINLSLSMSATGRSYAQNFFKVQYIIIQAILSRKSMKKFAVTDEKYSVSMRVLTVKNNSHADMRTSHAPSFWSKNKILS